MLAKRIQIRPSALSQFEADVNNKIKSLLRVMGMVEVVNDEGDKAMVSGAIKEGKQLIKMVSDARKAITNPLQEEVKHWISKEKALIAPIEEAMQRADQLIKQFNARIAAEQQALLEKIEREEAAKLAQDDRQAEQVRQESEFKRQLAQASHSTDGVRMVWSFEVENLSTVPRDFLMLDEQKVRNAIRAGIREIPGIKIFQKQQTVYR
jgi:polyribonucleotide nucleotidyltransferase